jgi:PKD repeat protein
VVIGLQDNGTKSFSSSSWSDVLGGDGMECAIDPTNANTQYGEVYYGDIYRTTDHWWSTTYITGSLSDNAAWVTPYVIDPNNNSTLYTGRQSVWKSLNQGNSWSQISSWNGATLRSLAVAASNSSYIYAATRDTLYKTSDCGSTWSVINGSLPVASANITYISIKNDDPNTLWVTFSGFNSHGVYESADGGITWINISAGLPALPVNCVIQNTQNTTQVELYAGTDVGVLVKSGSGIWIPYFSGLPNVVVNELEIYYDSNPSNSKIHAATFGRGLWESDLLTVTLPPVADFTADNTMPSIEDTVSLTDLSVNVPTSWHWVFTPATVTFQQGTDPTSQHPFVTFDIPGLYTVALTATNAAGAHMKTKTDYINTTDPAPLADFMAGNTMPNTEESVTFMDLSLNNPISWSWDFTPPDVTFMEGTSSTSQDPEVRFDVPCLYIVSLTATNAGGSGQETKTDYINATDPPPVVDFASDNTMPTTEEMVTFIDISVNNPISWTWVFTPPDVTYLEGTSNSSQHPKVRFDATGFFTVNLTANNAGGTGSQTKTDYIQAIDPVPVADFGADNITPTTDETVSFTDMSLNNPVSWAWVFDPSTVTFMEGTTTGSQHPNVRFDSPALYTVSLTSTNTAGSHTEIKTNYISVILSDINSPGEELAIDISVLNHQVYITLPEHLSGHAVAYNLSGQEVVRIKITGEPLTINGSGYYILIVTTNQGIRAFKVFIK